MKSLFRHLHQITPLILAFVLATMMAPLSAAEYRVGDMPGWVVPVATPGVKPTQKGEAAGDIEYLLIDKQVRVDEHGKTVFTHHVSKAQDNHGLEDIANINLDFDPSYEAMTLHAVRVIRDGVAIDKLKTAKIHVLQREKELEYLVYDGGKTVNIVLQDVRVGDVVDYSYSVEGSNPVFQGRVVGGTQLQWGVPVDRVAVRLLEPEQREIHVVMHNTDLRPQVSVHDGVREYRFVRDNVPAIDVESDAPDWYDPFAEIQWSEYASWTAVVQWALPLYQPGQISAELKNEIDRIGREHGDPEGRLLAALYLVQHDIRYLGVEIGPGSHAPNPPSLVFQRRFGDCKDKTLLLVTILRALGIDANPALVNTVWKDTIADMWPTPTAFDHVIVHATLKGKGYWLDATRAPQAGDLSHVFQPDFGLALILDAKTANLSRMESPHSDAKRIHAVYDSSKGLDAPVTLKIMSSYAGRDAERLLADLASDGKEAVEKQYLNFYAHDYNNIRSVAPMTVQRDDADNVVTTTEVYEIPDFWVRSKENGRLEANIKTTDIDSVVGPKIALHRIAPLKIDFPKDVEQTTEIKLPEKFSLSADTKKVDDPAFAFSNTITPGDDGMSLTLVNKFSALTDHVNPGDLARYAGHLDDAYQNTGYMLWKNNASIRKSNASTTVPQQIGSSTSMPQQKINRWLVCGMALLSLAALCLIAYSASAPQHRQINLRLISLFMGDAVLIAISIAVGMPPEVILAFVVVFVVLLGRGIRSIRKHAPPTHWLQIQPFHRLVSSRVSKIGSRLFWVVIGMALMKIISG